MSNMILLVRCPIVHRNNDGKPICIATPLVEPTIEITKSIPWLWYLKITATVNVARKYAILNAVIFLILKVSISFGILKRSKLAPRLSILIRGKLTKVVRIMQILDTVISYPLPRFSSTLPFVMLPNNKYPANPVGKYMKEHNIMTNMHTNTSALNRILPGLFFEGQYSPSCAVAGITVIWQNKEKNTIGTVCIALGAKLNGTTSSLRGLSLNEC